MVFAIAGYLYQQLSGFRLQSPLIPISLILRVSEYFFKSAMVMHANQVFFLSFHDAACIDFLLSSGYNLLFDQL